MLFRSPALPRLVTSLLDAAERASKGLLADSRDTDMADAGSEGSDEVSDAPLLIYQSLWGLHRPSAAQHAATGKGCMVVYWVPDVDACPTECFCTSGEQWLSSANNQPLPAADTEQHQGTCSVTFVTGRQACCNASVQRSSVASSCQARKRLHDRQDSGRPGGSYTACRMMTRHPQRALHWRWRVPWRLSLLSLRTWVHT